MATLSDLHREFIAASRFSRQPSVARGLIESGIAISRDLAWGIAQVREDGPYYEPDPDGVFAFIVPVFDDESGYGGDLIDLVATSLLRRGVRRRRGEARVLGWRTIQDALWYDRPLVLFDDPLAWLAGGKKGAVILDWRVAPRLLDGLPQIVCQSPRLARRLARAFAQPVPLPPVIVPNPLIPPSKEQRHAA